MWSISIFNEIHWNGPEILTVCVVHFVLFSELEIVSNHMYGWMSDDVRVPTIHVVDLYIIEPCVW